MVWAALPGDVRIKSCMLSEYLWGLSLFSSDPFSCCLQDPSLPSCCVQRCPHSSFSRTKTCPRLWWWLVMLHHLPGSDWRPFFTVWGHENVHAWGTQWEITSWNPQDRLGCNTVVRIDPWDWCIAKAASVEFIQQAPCDLVLVGLGQPFQQQLSPSSSHLNLAVGTKHLTAKSIFPASLKCLCAVPWPEISLVFWQQGVMCLLISSL